MNEPKPAPSTAAQPMPTFFVPHSQKYLPGYLAASLPEIADDARERSVQLPLAAGDLVFFNPAVFHGAGTNVTADVSRLVNLLQVGSASAVTTIWRKAPNSSRP